jgi:phenylalanyl-tRNA synthetase beta chain
MGPVYFEAEEASGLPDQQNRLVVAFTGRATAAHWGKEPRDVDLFDLKGCFEGVLSHMGFNFSFKPEDVDWCEGGNALRLSVRKKMVGALGLVHPAVLTAFEIEQPVFLAELSLDGLFNARHSVSTFEEIPAFPPSLRDMAVVVDDSVQAGDVLTTAARTGGKLLKSIDLFDIYTGKQVPNGKKSVALSLVFQSNERTLTDKDTQKSWDKILKKLQADFGAELR